jgi:uncharacterized RDD family membrane protein YckC
MSTRNPSDAGPIVAAPAWRRLAAYMIDYCVFMVPLLGLLTVGSWALFDFKPPISDNAWVNQGMVVMLLTIPVMLYFACCESSPIQGTVGKRLMKVMVVDTHGRRATFKRTSVRAIVKFVPWEYFHTLMWHWEGWPTNPAPATAIQYIAMTVGWLIVLWFLGSLFVGSGRTPYDRIAGTVACSARRHN